MARRGRFPTLKKPWVERLVRSELTVLITLLGADATEVWTLDGPYLVNMLVKDYRATFREVDLAQLSMHEDRFRPGVITYLLDLQQYMNKEVDDLPDFPGAPRVEVVPPLISAEELAKENMEAFAEDPVEPGWVQPPGLSTVIEEKQAAKPPAPASKARRYRGPLQLRKKSDAPAAAPTPAPAAEKQETPATTSTTAPAEYTEVPRDQIKPHSLHGNTGATVTPETPPPPVPPKPMPAPPPKKHRAGPKVRKVPEKKPVDTYPPDDTFREELAIGTFLALHMLVEHSGIPTRVELAEAYGIVKQIAAKAAARFDDLTE